MKTLSLGSLKIFRKKKTRNFKRDREKKSLTSVMFGTNYKIFQDQQKKNLFNAIKITHIIQTILQDH